MTAAIASRPWLKSGPVFYVQDLKGKVGDWGYTTDTKQAIPLTPYWQARFAADCRYAGVVPMFIPIPTP